MTQVEKDKLMESFMEELGSNLKSVPDLFELFYKLSELFQRKTEIAEIVAHTMIGSKLFYQMANIYHCIGKVEEFRKILKDSKE